MSSRIGRLALLATLSTATALAGCGRSSLLAADCVLTLSVDELDFGEVLPGSTATRTVSAFNSGSGTCTLAPIAIASTSDPGFTAATSAPVVIEPNTAANIAVTFTPPAKVLPLARKGTLDIDSNDISKTTATVALVASIKSTCTISVAPSAVDFGTVALGTTATRTVIVKDVGIGPCELDDLAIGMGSDPEFTVTPGQAALFDLDPGDSAPLQVTFAPTDVQPPHHRTGTFDFTSSDTTQANVAVPLSADIDVGCNLT
ncbi:MAG TPA: choice-of-anchor D domain-containing protein, partial [Polyangia bacterium]|nr:choice-of-anchor D domain-containing protein [Polyangia bacterium]